MLVPLRVELLSDCCTTINPAFDSGIFLTGRCVFLLGATDDGGPEAPVISTSDSLPTEESEENSISSSAGWQLDGGGGIFARVPLRQRSGGPILQDLGLQKSELFHNPMGAVTTQLTASVGRFRQRAFGQPLSQICPAMMWVTRFAISS